MKQFVYLNILGLLLLANSYSANAQCKTFAKQVCKAELTPFSHDGNYNAAVMIEGEEAEMLKTFYSGTEYRIAICGSEPLQNVEFLIYDDNNRLVYDNKDHNYAKSWDFKLKSTQQLRIVVKVPGNNTKAQEARQGCVSIMFGFRDR
jgi:hypothetical protein